MDQILRGDTLTRTAALHQQFMDGALTIDEWRAIENRNPVEDPDQHFVPLNMTTLGALQRQAEQSEEIPIEEPQEEPEEEQNIMVEAAKVSLNDVLGRMMRREEKAVIKASRNPREFLEFLDTYYIEHQSFVAQAIQPALKVWSLSINNNLAGDEIAKDICDRHRNQLLELSGQVTAGDLPNAVKKQIAEWANEEIVAHLDT